MMTVNLCVDELIAADHKTRAVVTGMGDPREDRDRREAARSRAARALRPSGAGGRGVAEDPGGARAGRAGRCAGKPERAQCAEMKHGDNALAQQKAIAGVHLSQSSSGAASLPEAVRRIESNLGRTPQ